MNSNNFSNFNNDKSQKTTDQLLKILQNSNDINSYLTDNDSNISNISFHEYLTQLLDEKGLTKAQVITDSNIQKNYGYQIFDGSKTPSRDKVIALALAMQLTWMKPTACFTFQTMAYFIRKSKETALLYSVLKIIKKSSI